MNEDKSLVSRLMYEWVQRFNVTFEIIIEREMRKNRILQGRQKSSWDKLKDP